MKMRVGDLVKIIRYGSRHAPDGTVGLIIEELPFDTRESSWKHRAYRVHCVNGHIARQAEFCLEVLSEAS
jgi:hypothetical protein